MSTIGLTLESAKVSKHVFLGMLWAFTGASGLFVVFRILVRLVSFRRLFLDDFFVLLAWAIMLTTAIIWQIEAQVLYDLYAVSSGMKPYTPDILPRFGTFIRFIAPLTILFYAGLWCIKFAFLTFFRRLGSKIKSHRVWWFVVLFVSIGVWISSVADIDYKCSVGELEYILSQCSSHAHVHYENRTFWANCAGDVVTDLMILSIPILILWNTRISLRKKLILFSVFSATILIMVIAVIRVVINNSLNSSVDISWLYFWSFIEMGTGIIIACIASFRQLFVTSQNQHLYGKAMYRTPYSPLLNRAQKAYGWTRSRSTGDSESQTSNTNILPLDSVHVRSDYDVVSFPAKVHNHQRNEF